MRGFQIAATVLLICAVAVVGVLIYGSQAEVTCTQDSIPAVNRADVFQNVEQAIDSGTVVKQIVREPLGDISGYSLAQFTVTVRNLGYLPMEWMTCDYIGAAGDVAVYDIIGLPADIPAKGEITFTIQLLRKSDAAGRGTLRLNYYVAGNSITKDYQ